MTNSRQAMCRFPNNAIRASSSENITVQSRPERLQLQPNGELVIDWSDGRKRVYTPTELGDACPSAEARTKRDATPENSGQLNVLSLEDAQPQKITSMEPVGNYAYSIHFNHGSNTGIYTFELLRTLGRDVPTTDD